MVLPTLNEIDSMPQINSNHEQSLKLPNIAHINCVAESIASGVANSSLAKEWIVYSVELSESIGRLVECKKRIVERTLYVDPSNIQIMEYKFFQFVHSLTLFSPFVQLLCNRSADYSQSVD